MLNLSTETLAEDNLCVYSFAVAGLARLAGSCTTLDENVIETLQQSSQRVNGKKGLMAAFHEYLKHPVEADNTLLALARQFRLTTIEVLAVRLTIATEEDLLVGHVLAHLQQPLAQTRPTIGLLAAAYGERESRRAVHVLAQGSAVNCGLLQLLGEDLASPEKQVRIAPANSLALQGIEQPWPGTSLTQAGQFRVILGRTAESQAATFANRLSETNTPAPAMIIRAQDSLEGRAAAERLCSNCSMSSVLVHTDQLMGMAPWLFLNGLLPVFSHWLAPGERKSLPVIPSFDGPLIMLTGPEGDFESEDRSLIEWRIEIPQPSERQELWEAAIDNRDLASRMAAEHRHTAGRIAVLAAKARVNAGKDNAVTYADIRAVARRESVGLGALAELILDEVSDEALVVPDGLRDELESLVSRCRQREQFSNSLGPSIRARYRPAVRALFVGPSGTGKTLAAAWLATRLGIPLYRVDLSAITSKYIGETEKNLSQLLSRAEHNEVLLLFDEADALFGKRTDIQEANDRFANAQTNYLLQRMESYDGITVLTSNGRSRFDAAFSRRFDAILSFPLPGPEDRRALWASHLGTAHGVNSAQLNRLAAVAELSGGQIRNAVLSGAVAAAGDGGTILYPHLLAGITSEYRKLSRQLPNELRQAEIGISA